MKRAVYHKLELDTSYPLEPPFDPPAAYPEFDRARRCSDIAVLTMQCTKPFATC